MPAKPKKPNLWRELKPIANWSAFNREWNHCQRCPLCRTRSNVVQFRYWNSLHEASSVNGQCDILFIGEAPGESEDVTGKPFTGPSGKLLNTMIREAYQLAIRWGHVKNSGQSIDSTPSPIIAFANVVACVPIRDNGGTIGTPTANEIEACSPRLIQLVNTLQPLVVVAVGKTAANNFPGSWKRLPINCPFVEHQFTIQHPAAILRTAPARKLTEQKNTVHTIADAFIFQGKYR